MEALFRQLDGVQDVTAGYCGGDDALEPTYESVCNGQEGHAEAVQIVFDPAILSYAALLEVFFSHHDPTTLNRQGPNVGSQYRSVIFFQSKEQEKNALRRISELEQQGHFGAPIVTQVVPLQIFWQAEEYHQRYYEKHGIR